MAIQMLVFPSLRKLEIFEPQQKLQGKCNLQTFNLRYFVSSKVKLARLFCLNSLLSSFEPPRTKALIFIMACNHKAVL